MTSDTKAAWLGSFGFALILVSMGQDQWLWSVVALLGLACLVGSLLYVA